MLKLMLNAALVAVLSGCADLIVTGVDDAPFQLNLLMMKATVKNDGTRDAPASTTRLQMKTPTTDFTQQSVRPTPPLARGQEITLDMWPFHLNGLVQPGQCIEVRVCADSADAVSEGWVFEWNNCRTRSFCRP